MMPSDGEWQVCALLTPSTGVSIYASSPTIIRDTVPPEVVETQVVKEGNPYILDVSVNEKDTVEAWTKVSGDGVLTFAPLDGGGVSVTSDQIGNYVAKLTLTDKAGNRSEVQVDIPISADHVRLPGNIAMYQKTSWTMPATQNGVVNRLVLVSSQITSRLMI